MFTRKRVAVAFVYIGIFFFALLTFRVVKVSGEVDRISNKIEKDSYLDKYDLSLVDYDHIDEKLDEIEKDAISKEVTLDINNKSKEFSLKELGVSLNKEEIKNDILEYEKSVDYYDRYSSYSRDSYKMKNYSIKYVIDDDTLREFLTEIKKDFDIAPKKGKLVMNTSTRELEYKDEVVGYSLNVDKSIEVIKKEINDKDYSKKIVLISDETHEEDIYKTINKKISTYTTYFKAKEKRKYNLAHAANLINGTIVMPGKMFSYYNNAGPYIGNGYIVYHGISGNGVCQVASTLYNAELLAGLLTVTRYAHPDMPLYTPGGLDATVSTTPTFNADFKFRNILDYPIYISAYVDGTKGTVTVDIWSNENATKGVTYKLRSVKRAYGSYDAYRDYYQGDKLIRTENLGHSWYKKEATELY